MKRSLLLVSLLFTVSAFAATDVGFLAGATEFEPAKTDVETSSADVVAHEKRIESLRAEATRLDQQIASAQGRPEHAEEMTRLMGVKRQTLEQCNALVDQLEGKIRALEAKLAKHGRYHQVINNGGQYTLAKHEARPVSTTTVAAPRQAPREAYARSGSYYPRAERG